VNGGSRIIEDSGARDLLIGTIALMVGIALMFLILGVAFVWVPGLALIGFGVSRFVRGWKTARRDGP
jgi:hypothetical protein